MSAQPRQQESTLTLLLFRSVLFQRLCIFFPKKDGLRLFTEDMVEVKSLPRQSVLDHFIACAPTLVIPYLVSGREGGRVGGREGGGGRDCLVTRVCPILFP